MDSLFILAKETEEGLDQAWLDAQPQVGELDDYMNEIVRKEDEYFNKIIVIYGNDTIVNPFKDGIELTPEMEEDILEMINDDIELTPEMENDILEMINGDEIIQDTEQLSVLDVLESYTNDIKSPAKDVNSDTNDTKNN